MITIKQPIVTIKDGKARLSADVDVDGISNPLWFEVDEVYAKYLCYERIDAYVLGLLRYANLYNHDIQSEVPMTQAIYENLTQQFLPAFYKVNNYTRDNKNGKGFSSTIICPVAPEVERLTNDQFIGAGVSCGVDSLHVFALHPEITHGCVWNVHGVSYNETKEKRDKGWENLVSQAHDIMKDTGKKLIVGDTNFDRGWMPKLLWDSFTTHGNLFFILALQKMWSKYYVGSDCDIHDFKIKLPISEDPAHYEFFLFPYVSTSHCSVYMEGHVHRRIEKVKMLLDYPLAKKYLNVCWGLIEDNKNCSYKCAKCVRTMWSLYLLDALDEFKDRFDVEYFYNHLEEYLAEYYRGLIQKDFFMVEMKPYYKNKSGKISLWTKLLAMRIVFKKAFKKALRLGKVAQGEFKSR